jgi:hypothetical protein
MEESMTNTQFTSPEPDIRLLPNDMTVAKARELVPRGVYGIVVDEKGYPLTCLFYLERFAKDWPADATLEAMRAHWPGLVTLPAAQAVDDRRVAWHFLDELDKHPDLPAIVLVDEQGHPVAVLNKHRLNKAAPELTGVAIARLEGSATGPSEPPIERKLVTRYSRLQLPDQIQLRVPCKLKVAINLEPQAEAQGQVELSLRAGDWPLPVVAQLVNVQPEDFTVDGPDFQVIEVPKDKDSSVYAFRLIPQSLGEKTVRVKFMYKGLFVATAKVTTEVVEDQPAQPGDARVEHPPVLAYAGPPPDFTIYIDKLQGHTYTIHVARATDDPLQPPRKLGEIDFELGPKDYMQRMYGKLNKRAKQRGGAAELIDGLQLEGSNLYLLLFRDEGFQTFYWQEMRAASEGEQPNVPVVQIVSQEPYTAWELVRPWRKPPKGLAQSDPLHLCERFALTRWVSEAPGPSGDLLLRRIAIVAPPSNLKHVQPEVDALKALATQYKLQYEIVETKSALMRLLKEGKADILHFACHGKFNLEEAESSMIVLGKERMEASEIVGFWINWNGRRDGLLPSKPLVFFNVCDSAQVGLGLTGLDGWADRFLSQTDAGFFIGSIWKTTDELACEFAKGFYSRLLAGTPVAEALRQAREDVKQERVRRNRGRDATHLTYSVFANPQATCSTEA